MEPCYLSLPWRWVQAWTRVGTGGVFDFPVCSSCCWKSLEVGEGLPNCTCLGWHHVGTTDWQKVFEVLRRLLVPVCGAIFSGIYAEQSTLFLLEKL